MTISFPDDSALIGKIDRLLAEMFLAGGKKVSRSAFVRQLLEDFFDAEEQGIELQKIIGTEAEAIAALRQRPIGPPVKSETRPEWDEKAAIASVQALMDEEPDAPEDGAEEDATEGESQDQES